MNRAASNEGKIVLSWIRDGGRRAAVAYSSDLSSIDYRITDYSIYLSDTEALDAKTVETETLHLKAFLEYLGGRIRLEQVSDKVLQEFRDAEYLRVRKAANASGSIKCAQRTVNAKLRRAYLFLLWAQSVDRSIVGVIGATRHPVTSCLPDAQRVGKISGRRTHFLRDQELYPLLFRNAAARSRHGTQYEATDNDIRRLSDFFRANCSPYAAQRNILMMELATRVSWRRASVNSLTCDQFSKLYFEDFDEDELVVVPPSQKFGYERAFDVPFRLAFRVAEFIATTRQQLLTANRLSESKTRGRVFLSERTGTPLRDSSLSQVFARAFSHLGRPRGANFHSFRRKFANDLIEQEIQIRLDLGLDTSALSIAAAVAQRMGHANPESLMPYVSSRLGRLAKRVATRKPDRLRALEDENRALKMRIARLELA